MVPIVIIKKMVMGTYLVVMVPNLKGNFKMIKNTGLALFYTQMEIFIMVNGNPIKEKEQAVCICNLKIRKYLKESG